ncbi:MAG: lipoprotein [Pseudomonadota bacterium]
MPRTPRLVVTVLMCVCLAVAACGRKGPLEPPPGATKPPPLEENEAVKPGPRASNPDRPFILDGLL